MSALITFVVVVGVNMLALLLDLALRLSDLTTITERVSQRPWLGLPLLAWQLLGFLALAFHLYPRGG